MKIMISNGADPVTAKEAAPLTWGKWGGGKKWDFPSECKRNKTSGDQNEECTCGHCN